MFVLAEMVTHLHLVKHTPAFQPMSMPKVSFSKCLSQSAALPQEFRIHPCFYRSVYQKVELKIKFNSVTVVNT